MKIDLTTLFDRIFTGSDCLKAFLPEAIQRPSIVSGTLSIIPRRLSHPCSHFYSPSGPIIHLGRGQSQSDIPILDRTIEDSKLGFVQVDHEAACYTVPLETDSRNPECLVPGRDVEVISKKGTLVDRGKFEQSKNQYYEMRGWDVTSGLQTVGRLQQLELKDIAGDLEQRGLVLKA